MLVQQVLYTTSVENNFRSRITFQEEKRLSPRMTSLLFTSFCNEANRKRRHRKKSSQIQRKESILDFLARSFTTQGKRGSLNLSKMATDSTHVGNFFKDAVENKGAENKRQDLVFNRATGELEVKRKEEVTSADRKVHLKMTIFFNDIVVHKFM